MFLYNKFKSRSNTALRGEKESVAAGLMHKILELC